MRAHRFVDVLGSAAETAGEAVAEAADVTAAHRGGLDEAGIGARVGRELLRQLARQTDGSVLDRVEFESRAVSPDRAVRPGDREGLAVGVRIAIDLSTYRARNAVVGTVVHVSQLAESSVDESHPIREQLQSQCERFEAPVLFVVTEEQARVVPARAVLGREGPMTEDILEHLYTRSMERFTAMLVEGFLGFSPEMADLGAWLESTSLQGGFALQVSERASETDSSLSAYLD